MPWARIFTFVVFVSVCSVWTRPAHSREPLIIKPQPLKSPTGEAELKIAKALNDVAPALCQKIVPRRSSIATLTRARDELSATPETDPLAIRQALIDRASVDPASLPSSRELESTVPSMKNAALSRLIKAKRETADRLSRQAVDDTLALRASAGRDAAAMAKVECDPACGERVVQSCATGERIKPPPTARAAASVSGPPGVSWVEGVAAPALAQFLADRTEAELTLWLVTTFQNDLCSKVERAAWFPNMCAVTQALTSDQQIPGTLLSSALRRDLEALPVRTLKQLPALKLDDESIEGILAVLNQMREGQAPLPLLAGLATNDQLSAACTAHRGAACTLKLIGTAVTYCGDAVEDGRFDEQLELLARQFTDYLQKTCGDNCAGLSAEPEKATLFLRSVNALVVRLRDYSAGNVKDSTPTQKGSEVMSLTADVIDSAAALIKDVELRRNWSKISLALRISARMFRGDYTDGARDLIIFAQQSTVAGVIKMPKEVVRYLPFIVDMASAKDAAQARAALSAAAAPVGSWRIKRRATTVSVTALVGGSAGYEVPVDSNGRNGAAASALMAALGIDIAVPIGTWTVGPFLSLIDVGQLVSTPINPESSSSATTTNSVTTITTSKAKAGGELKAVQIFAPGAYFRVGAGNSPFTFGVGAVVAPELREYVDVNPNTPDTKSALSMVRAQAFLAVDLTLFPF